MLCQIISAVAVLLPVIVVGSPLSKPLPPCSANPVPCVCPTGSTFGNATTYALIGARADDAYSIMGYFYKTDFLGLTIVGTDGPENTVGSKRTLNITSNGSTYQLVETLTTATRGYGGSFKQQFEQTHVPVLVPEAQGGGAFYGYWVTLDVSQTVFEYESLIVWNVYSCLIGNPFGEPFTTFHENIIKNVTATLQGENKLHGIGIGPYSTQT